MYDRSDVKSISNLIIKMVSNFSEVSLVVSEPSESSYHKRLTDFTVKIEDYIYIYRYNESMSSVPSDRVAISIVRGAFADYLAAKLDQ